jgi:hypothetical protein
VVILLNDVVELLASPERTPWWAILPPSDALHSFGIRSIAINGDHPRRNGVVGVEQLAEEPMGGSCIAVMAQHELERFPFGINGTIHVHPAAFDLHIGLVDPP